MRSCPVIAALTLFWVGCGANKNVKLLQPPEVATATQPARPAADVYVLSPVDERPVDHAVVGYRRNIDRAVVGYLVTEDDVPAWVATALVRELGRAGYRVHRVSDGDRVPEGSLSVATTVTKVLCGTDRMAYSAEVALDVELRRSGRPLVSETFESRYRGGTNWNGTPEGYGETLGLALQDAARKAVALVKQPIIGLPSE